MSSDSQEDYNVEESSSEIRTDHGSIQNGVDEKLGDSDLKQNVSAYQSKERLLTFSSNNHSYVSPSLIFKYR